MNESGRRVGFLDYVRGIAILSVFLFHSLDWVFHYSTLPWHGWFRDFSVPYSFLVLLPVSFGWAGVAIFFVVSGFCIHFSFHQHGRDWRSFFVRRFFRIYPPYFFAVILFGVFANSSRLDFSIRQIDWYQLIVHLLLIHNVDPYSFFTINSSFWSIAVEIQLYLIYPVLLMLVAKLGWRRALILVAGCEILTGGIQGTLGVIYGIDGIEELGKQQSLWHLFYYIAASPLAFWFSWSLGAVIADAYLEKRALPLAKSSLFLWLVLAVGSNFIKPLSPFCFLLFAVSTATAISKLLSGARPGIRIPDFCLKHLRLSGIWSYSIYLLHQPLIGIGISILVMICPVAGSHPLVQFASCLVLWFAIMLIGGLWYRLCELPSIACGKRIIQSAFSGRL